MNVCLLPCITFALVAFAAFLNAQSAGNVIGWGDGSLGQYPAPLHATNIVAVSAGTSHSVGLRNDGTVLVWGNNNQGQVTGQPANLNGVAAIAAGGYHTLALRSNGSVVAWGLSDAGQTNVPAAAATGVSAIAAGEYFSMALKLNGTVVVWGGLSSTVGSTLNQITAIAAGTSHALALRSDGVVIAWGANSSRQTNVPVTLRATQIAAGESHSLALTTGGAILGWGNNSHGQSTNGAAPAGGVQKIFAGKNHSGALKNDRSVLCWGDNTHFQRNVPPLPNVTAVASGGAANHNLAIVLDKPSITTQPFSQSVGLGQNATFTVIAAGSPPLFFQWRKDGTNLTAANGSSYFINNAQNTHMGGYSVVVTNSVGAVTSLVANLTVNSSPLITSHPVGGTVGVNGSIVFSVAAAGTAPLHYQWRKDGTNIAAANSTNLPINTIEPSHAGAYSVVVSNLYGIATSSNAVLTVVPVPAFVSQPVAQSALLGSSVTLRTRVTNALAYQWVKNGTNIPGATSTNFPINRAQPGNAGNYFLRAWNDYGTNTSSTVALVVQAPTIPSDLSLWGEDAVVVGLEYIDMTPPLGLTNLTAIAMGAAHNLALRADGTVVGWGDNQHGQAGLPPTLIASSIAAGANHTLALTNGKVGAWGLNAHGQASPPDVTSVRSIAAGADFSLAVSSNGLVTAWGNAPVTPVRATNIVAIAAGVEHVLALREDGTVLAWGGNTEGQVRSPFAVTNVNAGVMRLAAGDYHSLALKSNGAVIAWGKGSRGQTNVPVEASNIVAIAAGGEHSVALRADGAVICWGYDNWGQSVAPMGLLASGVAAAGDRTLAIGGVRRPAVLTISAANGGVRLVISNQDGAPFDPSRVGEITIRAGADLSTVANWQSLTNSLTVTNGTVIMEDTFSGDRRFYIMRQQ